MDLQAAKDKLTIHDVWSKLNLPGESSRLCSAPWREDKKPSLSISRDGRLWNDFGSELGGDAVCFIEAALGLTRKEACYKLIELAGGNVHSSPAPAKRVQRRVGSYKRREKIDLPECAEGSAAQRKRLAMLRGLRLEAVELAIELGLLRFCKWYGVDAWLIADDSGINAQVRRLDGALLGKVKAMTLPNSRAKWPIGVPARGSNIILVEGGPDLLAACQICVESSFKVSPVCMFGRGR